MGSVNLCQPDSSMDIASNYPWPLQKLRLWLLMLKLYRRAFKCLILLVKSKTFKEECVVMTIVRNVKVQESILQ
jgi:hypothetical protein